MLNRESTPEEEKPLLDTDDQDVENITNDLYSPDCNNNKPQLQVLATVSVARYHTTAQNPIYKYNMCKKACKEVAPPRTYHCDYCGHCILRMDHHCFWMGTCIGLLNYKFYWQFLLYATSCMLILTITVLV